MFKMIEGLPQNVLAIEATGKFTHEDYQHTLIPRAEAMMAKGPIKMLYVLDRSLQALSLRRCGMTERSGSGTGTSSATSPW